MEIKNGQKTPEKYGEMGIKSKHPYTNLIRSQNCNCVKLEGRHDYGRAITSDNKRRPFYAICVDSWEQIAGDWIYFTRYVAT